MEYWETQFLNQKPEIRGILGNSIPERYAEYWETQFLNQKPEIRGILGNSIPESKTRDTRNIGKLNS